MRPEQTANGLAAVTSRYLDEKVGKSSKRVQDKK